MGSAPLHALDSCTPVSHMLISSYPVPYASVNAVFAYLAQNYYFCSFNIGEKFRNSDNGCIPTVDSSQQALC